MGYRNDTTTGIAKNDEPETIYMVTSGTHYNDRCCFDYGSESTRTQPARVGAAGARRPWVVWWDAAAAAPQTGPHDRRYCRRGADAVKFGLRGS